MDCETKGDVDMIMERGAEAPVAAGRILERLKQECIRNKVKGIK